MRSAALLGLLLVACSSRAVVVAPRASGAGTVVVVYADEGERPRAHVFAAAERWKIESESSELLWLEYAETPALLGLRLGVLPELAADDPSRAPPLPARAAFSDDAGDFAELSPSDLDTVAIWRLLRFPPFGPLECLEQGGCTVMGACRFDCAPEPVLAATPTLPTFDCPSGWTRGRLRALAERLTLADPRLPSVEVCRPTYPSAECARGAAAFGDADACEPLGDCANDWDPTLPGDAVYIRRGAAAGGDGTRAAPFATVEAALSARPQASTLAIHGLVELSSYVELGSGRRTFMGACAARDGLAWGAQRGLGFGPDGTLALSTLRIDLGVGGEALRAEGSTLTLDRVDLISEAASADAVVTGNAGRLVMSRSRLQSTSVLRVVNVDRGGHLDATRVVFEGGTNETLLAVAAPDAPVAQISLDRVTVRGPSFGVSTNRADLRASALAVFSPAPVLVVDARAELDASYLFVPVSPKPIELRDTPNLLRGDSVIRKTFIEVDPQYEGRNCALVVDRGESALSDLIIDAPGNEGALLADGTVLAASRILLMDPRFAAFNARSTRATLAHVTTVGGAVGLDLASVMDRRGSVDVADALVAGFHYQGVRDTQPGRDELALRRVEARSGDGYGLAIRYTAGTQLEDITVRDISSRQDELELAGSCLSIRVPLDARRLHLERCARAGLFLELGAAPIIRALTIQHATAAVAVEELDVGLDLGWETSLTCGTGPILVDSAYIPVTPHRMPACPTR